MDNANPELEYDIVSIGDTLWWALDDILDI
jgi:hypothetical protein